MPISRNLTRLALYLFALCATQSALAQYRAVAPTLPPLIVSQDGFTASSGQAVEITQAAAARAGIHLGVEIQPWARAYDTGTKNKNVFLLPVARTPEREPLFEWLGPVNRHDYKLFRLKGSKAPAIHSIQQIGDNQIGVLNGIFVHDYLKSLKLTGLQTTPHFPNLVAMFVFGRFDYLASTRASLSAELAKTNMSMEAVEALFDIDIDSPDAYSYLVLAKGSDPGLVKEMKKALLSMQKDGAWNKIFQKYQ